MDGLLLVDKPAGWTSHDAVAYVRGMFGEKRAGHTGTLDPDATGLLIVLIGKATRLAKYFEHDYKKYLAVMRLGAETDTEDAGGRVTRECPVPELAPSRIEEVFGYLSGEDEYCCCSDHSNYSSPQTFYSSDLQEIAVQIFRTTSPIFSLPLLRSAPQPVYSHCRLRQLSPVVEFRR